MKFSKEAIEEAAKLSKMSVGDYLDKLPSSFYEEAAKQSGFSNQEYLGKLKSIYSEPLKKKEDTQFGGTASANGTQNTSQSTSSSVLPSKNVSTPTNNIGQKIFNVNQAVQDLVYEKEDKPFFEKAKEPTPQVPLKQEQLKKKETPKEESRLVKVWSPTEKAYIYKLKEVQQSTSPESVVSVMTTQQILDATPETVKFRVNQGKNQEQLSFEQQSDKNNNVQAFNRESKYYTTYSKEIGKRIEDSEKVIKDKLGADFLGKLTKTSMSLNQTIATFNEYQKDKEKRANQLQTELTSIATKVKNGTLSKSDADYDFNLKREELEQIQNDLNQRVQNIKTIQDQLESYKNIPEVKSYILLNEKQNKVNEEARGLIFKDEYSEYRKTLDIASQKQFEKDTQKKEFLDKGFFGKVSDVLGAISNLSPVVLAEKLITGNKDKTYTGTAIKDESHRLMARTLNAIASYPKMAENTNPFGKADKYDFFDKIFDATTEFSKEKELTNQNASDVQRDIKQKYVEVDGYRVLLDDKGKPTKVTDDRFFNIGGLTQSLIINKYENNKDKYKDVKSDISVGTAVAKSVPTILDMGGLIALTTLTGGATAPLLGTEIAYGAATVASAAAQMYSGLYEGGIEAGLSPTEAGDFATVASLGVGSVSLVNPMEMSIAKNLMTRKVGKEIAEKMTKSEIQLVLNGKLKVTDLAIKYGKDYIKNTAGENLEEIVLEPFVQRGVEVLYNENAKKQGSGFEDLNEPFFNAKEVAETAIITSISTLLFSPIETASSIPNEKRLAVFKAIEKPNEFTEALNDKLEKGDITKERYDFEVKALEDVSNQYNSVKDNIKEKDKEKLTELLAKKYNLKKEISKINDDVLNRRNKSLLEDINKEIEGIITPKEAKPEKNKVEKVELTPDEKIIGFNEAGEKSKLEKSPKALGEWILNNGETGDKILVDDESYWLIEKSKNKRGYDEVILQLYAIDESGNYVEVKGADAVKILHNKELGTENEKIGYRQASDIFEYSYRNNNDEVVVQKSKYVPYQPQQEVIVEEEPTAKEQQSKEEVKTPTEEAEITTKETTPNDIEDKEYIEFINRGSVSEERLNDIANKVKKQEQLSDREKEIFADKTAEVNKIIAKEEVVPTKESNVVEGSGGVGGDVEIKNEGKAEAPTKESVTEMLNINNPFYKKVEDALVKLGLIEKYNAETGTGDVVGGYAQQTSDGGFSVGKMLFSQDGSISYFDGDVIVYFDKNGNVISENTKEAKQKAVSLEIESKKASIANFEKTRDSESFKYKEVTETDVLGNKKKVKRLKTEQELKESTDKINAAIDKAKAELSNLEQPLKETTKAETKVAEAEIPTTNVGVEEGSGGVGGDVEATAKKIVGESAFDKLKKEGYTIEKGKFDSDAYASFFGLHTGVQADEFANAGLRLVKPSEKIKVYRGKGKNVSEGENEGVTWVAEDKKVAENYSNDGNVEEIEVTKPKNPFPNPTDTIHVKGSDVGNKLKGILNRLFREGKVTKEQAIEASKAIDEFVLAAGEESELYSTKTNKKGVSSKYVKALQALGFDGIVQKESYNSGSPFTATKTGNETNTYGIFKAVEQSLKDQPKTETTENPALKDVESTAKALEGVAMISPQKIIQAAKAIDKIEYVEEQEARDIIESYTHYKSGNQKSPATRWAGWFQSVNAANKKFIVDDIQNDPKLRNAMLSLFYDVYKAEFNFKGTFDDFLNTEITLYRGITLADKKGVGQEGFSAFSTTKNRVMPYADEQALGKGQIKEIKITPKDTYGAVNYIGGGEVEVLVPTDFKKETLKDDFNRLVELNIGLFNEEQLSYIEKLYDKEDYISGMAFAKSVISSNPKKISEAYHKAKADGSNPELVEAVEDLIGKPTAQTPENNQGFQQGDGQNVSNENEVAKVEENEEVSTEEENEEVITEEENEEVSTEEENEEVSTEEENEEVSTEEENEEVSTEEETKVVSGKYNILERGKELVTEEQQSRTSKRANEAGVSYNMIAT